MSDIKIDDTGDILLDDGDIQFVTTKEDLAAQSIRIALSTNRGTWRYNTLFGVPWLANTYNKIQILSKANRPLADTYIKQGILERENVRGIESFTGVFDPTTRRYTVSADVRLTSGEIISISDII